MIPIFDFLTKAIAPVTQLIDELHTSEEEKLTIKQKMFEAQMAMTMKAMDYEKQLLAAQSKIVVAEAQGQSWLQRSWRPISMLSFLVLVVLDSFGLLAFRLSDEAWTLLQLGLSGYVVGRSVEKVVPKLTDVVMKNSRHQVS